MSQQACCRARTLRVCPPPACRYNPVLAKQLERLGGVRYMFLTHRDDVGDHERWAQHFGAQRILHSLECNERQGTDSEWAAGPAARGGGVGGSGAQRQTDTYSDGGRRKVPSVGAPCCKCSQRQQVVVTYVMCKGCLTHALGLFRRGLLGGRAWPYACSARLCWDCPMQ